MNINLLIYIEETPGQARNDSGIGGAFMKRWYLFSGILAALLGILVIIFPAFWIKLVVIIIGLAAIAYAAVVPTVQPGTGAGLELDAIGGVFVGGVSATGGYGSVIGTLAGVFVIVLLKTGLPYVGLQANWQQIITGLVLILAVLIDVIKRRRAAKLQ